MKTECFKRKTEIFQNLLYGLKKKTIKKGYDPIVILIIYNMSFEDT